VLRVEGGALAKFRNEGLEVLAGLRPGLLTDLDSLPGARILDGQFNRRTAGDWYAAAQYLRCRLSARLCGGGEGFRPRRLV